MTRNSTKIILTIAIINTSIIMTVLLNSTKITEAHCKEKYDTEIVEISRGEIRQENIRQEEIRREENYIRTKNEINREDALYKFNISSKSYVNEEGIEESLKGTLLKGLGKHFIRAEEIYEINAMILLALCINESGWGTSVLANTKNNLFGIQAYDDNIEKARVFNSKEEGIYYTAKLIRDEYIVEGSSIDSINKTYASDKEWGEKIIEITKELYK